MKQVIASLLFFFTIVSCTNGNQTMTGSPTHILSPLATTTFQLYSTNIPIITSSSTISTLTPQIAGSPKPYVTASPIPFDPSSQDANKIIDTLFDKQRCTKVDYLTQVAPAAPELFIGYSVGKPQLIDITNQVDFSKIIIEEIADNTQKNFRAYLVNEPQLANSCSICIQSRVYVENQLNKRIYVIDWKGYLPSRVLGRLVWVGDNVLTFFQSIGPHSDELVGINISKQEFIYYAGLSCD